MKLRFKVNKVDPGSAVVGKVEVDDLIVGAAGKKHGIDQFSRFSKTLSASGPWLREDPWKSTSIRG
jgi:hypothetical protein